MSLTSIQVRDSARIVTAFFATLPLVLAVACGAESSVPPELSTGAASTSTPGANSNAGGSLPTAGVSVSDGVAASPGDTPAMVGAIGTPTGVPMNAAAGGATAPGGVNPSSGAGAEVMGGAATAGGAAAGGATAGGATAGGAAAGGAAAGGAAAGGAAAGGAAAGGAAAMGGVSPVSFGPEIQADVTVAADGSGDFRKVQDAVDAAQAGDVIFIKSGTYKEQVKVSKARISLVGESYESTLITGDKDADDGRNTHATVIVSGEDFYAEQVTIQNTVDSRQGGKQAEALNVSGDRAVFYKCKITGFQDTYRNNGSKRSYHKECIIEGTTDFIYGNGIALFEDCTINNRKDSHVTAANHSLKDGKPAHKFGYVFRNCSIKKHPDEKVTNASLGRPWGNAARVVYLNCDVGAHIRSDGWMEWNGRDNHQNSYYAEYKSTGPGAQPDKRLPWTHQLSDAEAATYTTENIFKANSTTATSLDGDWVPVIPKFQR